MKQRIDINADLGEGMGNDARIMPFISSCNIACGGHTGSEISMRETIQLAGKFNVKIGAHPSFPDRDNFGRKVLTMTKKELTRSVFHQLLHFYAVCEDEQVQVNHIKLHGALYNYAAKDAPTADAVVDAIVMSRVRPTLYLPFGSVLHRKAENLIPLKFEAFIDRRYQDDGSLVPRWHEEAIISSPEAAWNQLKNIVEKASVWTNSGKWIPLTADTYCIHGDHAHSVEIARYISGRMAENSMQLQ